MFSKQQRLTLIFISRDERRVVGYEEMVELENGKHLLAKDLIEFDRVKTAQGNWAPIRRIER